MFLFHVDIFLAFLSILLNSMYILYPLLLPLRRSDSLTSHDTESHLVLLLNQLCRRLMKNLDLLDFFFHANVQSNKNNNNHNKPFESGTKVPSSGGDKEKQGENEEREEADEEGEEDSKFLIFSILVNYLHRDGKVGQQAKDALLHCMSLSKKNEGVGKYIARHSNFCTVRPQFPKSFRRPFLLQFPFFGKCITGPRHRLERIVLSPPSSSARFPGVQPHVVHDPAVRPGRDARALHLPL